MVRLYLSFMLLHVVCLGRVLDVTGWMVAPYYASSEARSRAARTRSSRAVSIRQQWMVQEPKHKQKRHPRYREEHPVKHNTTAMASALIRSFVQVSQRRSAVAATVERIVDYAQDVTPPSSPNTNSSPTRSSSTLRRTTSLKSRPTSSLPPTNTQEIPQGPSLRRRTKTIRLAFPVHQQPETRSSSTTPTPASRHHRNYHGETRSKQKDVSKDKAWNMISNQANAGDWMQRRLMARNPVPSTPPTPTILEKDGRFLPFSSRETLGDTVWENSNALEYPKEEKQNLSPLELLKSMRHAVASRVNSSLQQQRHSSQKTPLRSMHQRPIQKRAADRDKQSAWDMIANQESAGNWMQERLLAREVSARTQNVLPHPNEVSELKPDVELTKDEQPQSVLESKPSQDNLVDLVPQQPKHDKEDLAGAAAVSSAQFSAPLELELTESVTSQSPDHVTEGEADVSVRRIVPGSAAAHWKALEQTTQPMVGNDLGNKNNHPSNQLLYGGGETLSD